MAASSMSEGDFRNRAQSSARVRSLASGTTAKHGHAAFPMPIKPEPLEDGATARSSLFKGADEFSDDQDLAYLLRALAGEGTDKEMLSTSDLGRSTSSLETLFDIDTGKSGLGGSDKASAPSLDDDLDGDGPDGGKKVRALGESLHSCTYMSQALLPFGSGLAPCFLSYIAVLTVLLDSYFIP